MSLNKRTQKQQDEFARALLRLCRRFKVGMSVDRDLIHVTGGPCIIGANFEQVLVQRNPLRRKDGTRVITLNEAVNT